MNARTIPAALAIAALLAACGEGGREETPKPQPSPPVPPATTATPVPEPAPPAAAAPAAPARTTRDARGRDWSHHVGDIPFLFGTTAGLAKAAETGKPLMLFHTAMT